MLGSINEQTNEYLENQQTHTERVIPRCKMRLGRIVEDSEDSEDARRLVPKLLDALGQAQSWRAR